MMKSVLLFLSILFFSASCSGDPLLIQGKGMIRHVQVEGGFYGIVGDDGNKYDPINLPAEFQKDNLRVEFKGKLLKDRVSFHMWGTLIEIESVSEEK